jgi:hypothetical protein
MPPLHCYIVKRPGPRGILQKDLQKIESMQLEGGLGGMQLKIQTNPKESSMVELFYLKCDWFHNALGEYIWNISYIPPPV